MRNGFKFRDESSSAPNKALYKFKIHVQVNSKLGVALTLKPVRLCSKHTEYALVALDLELYKQDSILIKLKKLAINLKLAFTHRG